MNKNDLEFLKNYVASFENIETLNIPLNWNMVGVIDYGLSDKAQEEWRDYYEEDFNLYDLDTAKDTIIDLGFEDDELSNWLKEWQEIYNQNPKAIVRLAPYLDTMDLLDFVQLIDSFVEYAIRNKMVA